MGILNITRCTLQKVSKKISKDFHDGFVQWKGGNFACNTTICATFRSKMKFKPDIFLIRASYMRDNPSLPFCFHPTLFFSHFVDALLHRLCTDGTDFSTQIVVDNRWYLGSAIGVLLSWESTLIIIVQLSFPITKAKVLTS